MIRRGFTLIEMLMAVVLSAMLMGALLVVLGGVARDQRVLRSQGRPPLNDRLLAQFRWDLANARTMTLSGDGGSIVLIGHGGIDRRTLTPTGRLVAVTYRCIAGNAGGTVVREQECLDDPAQPQRWREPIAFDVKTLSAVPIGADALPAGVAVPVPPRVTVRMESATGTLERELWLK